MITSMQKRIFAADKSSRYPRDTFVYTPVRPDKTNVYDDN